jgi:hypothetical protein
MITSRLDSGAIPWSLRTWFRVHCAVDLAAAIPLLLFPGRSLGLLGWTTIDPVATRLCGAALLAIGSASLMVDRYGVAGYRALLGLKIVWSVAAIFAFFAGIGEGAPPAAWAFLSIFIAFSGVWMSYAIRLRQLERVAQLPDDDGSNDDVGSDDDGAASGDR